MNTIRNLKRKFEALSVNDISRQAVANTKGALLMENKRQLLAGKTITGEDLSPTYLEDPYFHSREAAQAYSDWKDRITPNPERKKGVANLFIIGTFFESLDKEVQEDKILTASNFHAAADIVAKFTTKIWGLGGKYKGEYVIEVLRPEFSRLMEMATGLKMQRHG